LCGGAVQSFGVLDVALERPEVGEAVQGVAVAAGRSGVCQVLGTPVVA